MFAFANQKLNIKFHCRGQLDSYSKFLSGNSTVDMWALSHHSHEWWNPQHPINGVHHSCEWCGSVHVPPIEFPIFVKTINHIYIFDLN